VRCFLSSVFTGDAGFRMRMARVLQLFLMDETEIVEMKESIGTRI
jgi:hypothetical protein